MYITGQLPSLCYVCNLLLLDNRIHQSIKYTLLLQMLHSLIVKVNHKWHVRVIGWHLLLYSPPRQDCGLVLFPVTSFCARGRGFKASGASGHVGTWRSDARCGAPGTACTPSPGLEGGQGAQIIWILQHIYSRTILK